MMLFFKYFPQISLLAATSIISSVFVANLPAKAATFSSSEAFLFIHNFSITPQNPSVESNSTTVAVSRDDMNIAEAMAEADIIFQADSDAAFLSAYLYSDASGNGNNFFGFGESSSFAVGNFSLSANQTVSFDFTTALAIDNKVDGPLDGSVSTFGEIGFLLIDDDTNYVLDYFTAIGNIDTNLTDGINDDFLLVDDTNVDFKDSEFEEDFEGNIESASLFLQGSFQRFFDEATEVRLGVGALSRSCVQAPLTNDPCTRVPEPNNTVTLLFGFLGLGLFSRLARKT